MISGRAVGLRMAALAPLIALGIPAALLYLYLLVYWQAAVTYDGPCDPAVDGYGACGAPHDRAWWITAAATGLPGFGCILAAAVLVRRPWRWWPWPVAAVLLVTAGVWAEVQIGHFG